MKPGDALWNATVGVLGPREGAHCRAGGWLFVREWDGSVQAYKRDESPETAKLLSRWHAVETTTEHDA